MAEEKNRIDYLDKAKGIGILLVCIGHACTNKARTAESQYADIIRFITLFHMALFFFVNGMLYNEKYSKKPIEGIVKKVKSYYIPFLKYNLFFWAFHNMFSAMHLISGELDAKDYPYEGMRAFVVSFLKSLLGFRQKFAGAMWFLECLIIVSIIFILFDAIASRVSSKYKMLIMSIFVGSIVLINRLFNLVNIPYVSSSISQMVYWGLNGLLFFYLGYLYRKCQWNKRLVLYKYQLTAGAFVILAVTVCVMRPRIISVITNQSVPVYQYGIKAVWGAGNKAGLSLIQYLLYSMIGLIGIVMVLMVSQFKQVTKSKVISILGKYSLHIMCLHFFAFKLISFVIVSIYHLPSERMAEYPVVRDVHGLWWVAYTISGCALPVIFVKIGEKLMGIRNRMK